MDIEAIKARCEAATPGPWRGKADGSVHRGVVVCDDTTEVIARVWCGGLEGHGADNATFIAAARSDVSALVAEVERLRAEASTARAKALEEAAGVCTEVGKAQSDWQSIIVADQCRAAIRALAAKGGEE